MKIDLQFIKAAVESLALGEREAFRVMLDEQRAKLSSNGTAINLERLVVKS